MKQKRNFHLRIEKNLTVKKDTTKNRTIKDQIFKNKKVTIQQKQRALRQRHIKKIIEVHAIQDLIDLTLHGIHLRDTLRLVTPLPAGLMMGSISTERERVVDQNLNATPLTGHEIAMVNTARNRLDVKKTDQTPRKVRIFC